MLPYFNHVMIAGTHLGPVTRTKDYRGNKTVWGKVVTTSKPTNAEESPKHDKKKHWVVVVYRACGERADKLEQQVIPGQTRLMFQARLDNMELHSRTWNFVHIIALAFLDKTKKDKQVFDEYRREQAKNEQIESDETF